MIWLFNRCHHARISLKATTGRCITFIFFAHITGLFSCGERTAPAVPQLPATLGSFELKDTVVGVEAKKYLYRMHGALTGSQNCIIGYYSPDKKNALYISAFTDDKLATRALEKMLAKIDHSNVGFTPVTLDKKEDLILYRTRGMGLNHFFYRQGTLILWLQVEPEKSEETLTCLLKENFTVH